MKPKLGTGARFSQLTAALAQRGARNPKALAAYIGRKKYGKRRFQSLAWLSTRYNGLRTIVGHHLRVSNLPAWTSDASSASSSCPRSLRRC